MCHEGNGHSDVNCSLRLTLTTKVKLVKWFKCPKNVSECHSVTVELLYSTSSNYNFGCECHTSSGKISLKALK